MTLTRTLSLVALLAGVSGAIDAPAASASGVAVETGFVLDLGGVQPLFRRGRGADDPAGDDRGGRGRGADDGANHTWMPGVGTEQFARRGRGADDGANHDAGDDRGGHGADDGPNHA